MAAGHPPQTSRPTMPSATVQATSGRVDFMYYNFCRVHTTLRVPPAMEAGLADHVWSVEEMVALIPEHETKKGGSYKKRTA